MLKINKEREKFLIEAMGFKFNHHSDNYIWTNRGMWDEWNYFGKLWEFVNRQRWFGNFLLDVAGEDNGVFGPRLWPISQHLIDAEGLADVLYKYILANKGNKNFEKFV